MQLCVLGGRRGEERRGEERGERREEWGRMKKFISDATVCTGCNILTSSLGINLTLMSVCCPERRMPVEGSTSK